MIQFLKILAGPAGCFDVGYVSYDGQFTAKQEKDFIDSGAAVEIVDGRPVLPAGKENTSSKSAKAAAAEAKKKAEAKAAELLNLEKALSDAETVRDEAIAAAQDANTKAIDNPTDLTLAAEAKNAEAELEKAAQAAVDAKAALEAAQA